MYGISATKTPSQKKTPRVQLTFSTLDLLQRAHAVLSFIQYLNDAHIYSTEVEYKDMRET